MSRRLFIFDLDGVLVDSKKIHFDALNLALKEIDEKYVITEEQQEDMFEGLPTKEKLEILTNTRKLPRSEHEKIWKSKQEKSIQFFKELKKDNELIEIFRVIIENQVDIAVASNCIRETVEACLKSLGVIDYVKLYLSNEDVESPKPDPEIYLKAIKHFGCAPHFTTIFEDSRVGKTGAIASGSTLVSIENRSTINLDFILNILNQNKKKINVLIPMAGEGSRFAAAGYKDPKPLIDVNGKSMINLVYDTIKLDAHYIFIAKSDHIEQYNLHEHIAKFCNDFTIVPQDGKLDGAAQTALLAQHLIDNDDHLIIANSDQYVDWDCKIEVDNFIKSGIDGSILSFTANEKKWSYFEETNGIVTQVYEKIIVGDHATCGIYYWRSGSDFIKYAKQMISKNIKTNGEFYICPVYNQAIEDNKIISFLDVRDMIGLGTPEDLEEYLKIQDSFADIDTKDYVDTVYPVTPFEMCVKYKNVGYEAYDRPIKMVNGQARWDYDSDLINLNNSKNRDIYPAHRWMLNPIIRSIDNTDNFWETDQAVYVSAYTTRFFHIYLEIVPKLFFLKSIDPNFKLVLLGDEAIDDNGDFLGLSGHSDFGREGDSRCLKFWLDKLEIDYECINLDTLNDRDLIFKKSYVFYERIWNKDVLKSRKFFSKVFITGDYVCKNLKKYYPFSMLNKGDFLSDYAINLYLRKMVNETIPLETPKSNKKIYISRKNYTRVHPNEKEIEKFFVSRGYKSICMEDFTVDEQIKICKDSSDIVCFLGSTLVNMYFLTTDTNITVLTLSSESDQNFNQNMFIYYSQMIQSTNVSVDLVDIPSKIKEDEVQSLMERLMK